MPEESDSAQGGQRILLSSAAAEQEVMPGDAGMIAIIRRYRHILDSATETGIITIDRTGIITGWSKGAHHILGWTEAEMLGTSLARIFPPEDKNAVLQAEIRDAESAGTGGHEGWRVRKDGTRIWAVGEMKPLFDHQSRLVGFVKVVRDRTQAREAETILQERTRALEILNQAGIALAKEHALEAVIQIVTDAGVALAGAEFGAFFYNVSDASGERAVLHSAAGIPREAFSKYPQAQGAAVLAPRFAERAVVRSDDLAQDLRHGKTPPPYGLPERHQPVRSYLAIPIISRSDKVIGGLFLGHSEPARFTEMSERNLRGLASEAAIAIDNANLFDEAQREIAERRRAEIALIELNGRLEDEVKRRSAELQQSTDALRQAQKMEAVGQLTGGIAHDFNNLLQIIVGNLEIVSRNLPEDMVRLRRASMQAMTGAKRAAALTQRLLAFARRQPLDPKPLDANGLVRGMSELLRRALGETIYLETVLGGGLWKTEADPNELESALLNLAVNARDAMPNGGKLTIETANSHLDDAYAHRQVEVTPGQYVLISVSDTGSGMDAETMSRVFEPFFTTKPEGRGTGLGLSQVYGFVKQTGGHVKLYSELGEGTTVKIYLPRLLGHHPDEDKHDVLIPEAAAGETILVVEDDPDVRAYSVGALVELGYRVLEAADGESALAKLKAEKVSLIFTDVVLPGGMTGADVVAKAKVLQPDVKALFTTGYARNAIVHQGRLDRGVQLITKPFSFEDLAARVRDVLDGRS